MLLYSAHKEEPTRNGLRSQGRLCRPGFRVDRDHDDGDDGSTSQVVQLVATSCRDKAHLILRSRHISSGARPPHIHFDGNDVEFIQPPYAVRIAPGQDGLRRGPITRAWLFLSRHACTIVEFTLRCMRRSYLSNDGLHPAYHGSSLTSTATLSAASRVAHLPGPATRCHSCRLAAASHLRRNYCAFEASCLRRMNGSSRQLSTFQGYCSFQRRTTTGTLPSLGQHGQET